MIKRNIISTVIGVSIFVAALASYSLVAAQVTPVASSTLADSSETQSLQTNTTNHPVLNWDSSINYNSTDIETTLTVAGSGYVNLPPDRYQLI